MPKVNLDRHHPFLAQLDALNIELDQKMQRAFAMASVAEGTSDAQLFQALYHLNSLLTRSVTINEDRLTRRVFQYKKGTSISAEKCIPDYRLLRIFERAINASPDSHTLGVTQFLRAVIKDNEALGDDYFFRGHIPDMLAESAGYPFSTRFSAMPDVQRLIRQLDAMSTQTEDFQFIISLEDDRIRFRLTSILDDYVQGTSTQQCRPQRALLTHFKGTFGGFTQQEIGELEELLNSTKSREEDFQTFFERNPHFFRKWDYREVHPHVYLAHHESNLIPDFILTDHDLQSAMILELKKADFRLTRRQRNRDRFSDSVMEARAQLLTYRDWFRETFNRQRLTDKLGMEIYEPRLAVIIGRSSDFRDALDRQTLQSRFPDIEVVTYDDILVFAKRRSLILEGR